MSQAPKTPPAEFDRHALEIARGIASIDRSRLAGSTAQFVAILQEAIVQSMQIAADDAFKRGYAQRDAEVMGALV